MTAAAVVLSALAGLAAGFVVQRAAARFVPGGASLPAGAAVGAHGSVPVEVAAGGEPAMREPGAGVTVQCASV